MAYRDIYDRMKVNIPVASLGGMKVDKFEVVASDDWTAAHEKRDDVVNPISLMRMQMSGRAPKPGWYTRLSEEGTTWMSDTTAERRDHAAPVFVMSATSPERVLINGLGIGMVLSAALSFGSVKHVDVVERDKRVIDLVGTHYLKDKRVRIHHADAFEQMKKWPKGTRWDVGWSDIWPEICADNLPQMREFTDFYGVRCDFHGNWSEDIAKRSVWDNRMYEKDYLHLLTDEDKETFAQEDEDYCDNEDGDEDE